MADTTIEARTAARAPVRRLARFLAGLALAGATIMATPAGAATYLDETNPRLPALPYDANTLAMGDVNGDTHPDIVIGINGQVRILINDGAGNFTDETAARLPVVSGAFLGAALVDLTGDNRPELFLANAAGQNRLLINDGTGVFTDQTAARLPIDTDQSLTVAAGDIDGDGDIDFVVANRTTRNRVLINNGASAFTDQSAARLPADTDQSYGVALADVDGNGGLDLVVANMAGQDRIYINNNLGFFTDQTAARLPAAANDSLHVVAADVNKDGKPDLVVAGGAEGPRVLVNDGAGVFAPIAVPGQPEYAVRVAVGDVDFDGAQDIVVANAGQTRFLRSDGASPPTFVDMTATVVPLDDRRSFGIALFDFDHDLDLDLVLVAQANEERALKNFIAEPRILVAISPDYIEVGDTVTISVTTFDEDGVASTTVTVRDPNNFDTVVPLSGGTQGTALYNVPADNLQAGTHTVTVVSQDTLGSIGNRVETFVAQTADLTPPVVSIAVIEPAPLLFGKAVEITVTATDDREVATVNMTVNGVPVPLDSSGHATYVTSAVGLHTVDANATDLAGNVGNAPQQNFTVLDDVTPPVVNVSATPDPVDITNPVAIQASATDDVSVVSLTAKVEGPGTPAGGTPVPLDGSGMGSYIPYVPGTYTVTAEATDPKGNVGSDSATFEAQGVPDTEDPTVALQVTPINVEPGTPVSIHAEATDNIFVSSLTVDVNGIPVALDGSGNATFTPLALGDYTATATATDPTGNDGTMVAVFHAVDPSGDNTAPTAMITTPLNHAEVGLTTTIVGTANDNLALAQYTLAYAPMGTNNFTQFAQGFAPVVNGTLGTLNTAALQNGIYDIRLTTLDLNNNVAQAQRSVAVSGTFKPGVFSQTWSDLNITLAGTPIEILRTYDTRDRDTVGDFGHGWTLSIFQKGKYSNNIPTGEDWVVQPSGGFIPFNCSVAVENQLHVTEIRISDTEFYQFVPIVNILETFSSICEGTVTYQQVGGVPGATLVPLGGNDVYYSSGLGATLWGSLDFDEAYEPSTVRLTTIDGRVMDLNLNQGLTRIADRNGNALNISTGGVSHTSGTAVVFTRDGFGRITRITDPAGNFIEYAYDGVGDLVSVTDRAAMTTTFDYLSGHYLETITDPDGIAVLANEYDGSGLLSAQEDADGNRTEFTHDVTNGTETITRSDGTIKILRYGANGKLSEAEKDGVKKTFTYDAAGNVLTETNGEGIVRIFTYNAQNRLTSETDGAGNLRSYAYDAPGRLSTLTANGETVTFSYDANGNPTGMTDGDGQPVQSITPNAQGNPAQVTVGGGTYDQTYTAGGMLQTVAGPNGALTTYAYNARNEVTMVTVKRTDNGVPADETTTFVRDGNGRITEATDPLGHTILYSYDGKGNLASTTDKNGNVTTYEYDSRGNQTRINHPDGTFELTGYDLDYRVTSVSNRLTDIGDLLGNVTFNEYGSFNDITKITYQDGAIASYVSDLAGRRISSADPSGVVTTYEYDDAGRVTKSMNAFGQQTFTYVGTGPKPASMTDPLGKVTQYTYDNALFSSQRLLQTTYPDTTTRNQTWGLNHRVATRTDELGRTTSYTYDAAGNLATVTDPMGGITTYTYDEVRNRLTETDANGHTTSFRYDALGRLVRRTLPLGQFETFTYDSNGNKLTHTNFNGQTTSFTYDSMNRIATRTLPNGGGVTTYTYAANGKVATATDPLGVTTYTYDTRNRVTDIAYPDGSTVEYTYDAADRRTQIVSPAGAVDYTYDAAGRLKTVVDPNSETTTYSYDAATRITAKSVVGSIPTTSASYRRLSGSETVTRCAPDTTWLFVRM